MLFVVKTPTSGMVSMKRWMIEEEQVTMPEGIVNGPERVLPRNCVFKSGVVSSLYDSNLGNAFYNERT